MYTCISLEFRDIHTVREQFTIIFHANPVLKTHIHVICRMKKKKPKNNCGFRSHLTVICKIIVVIAVSFVLCSMQ